MATQKVLILSLAGPVADRLWEKITQWQAARMVIDHDELSAVDWPPNVRAEIDHAIDILHSDALVPPVLYRSEHVDCWSMGDTYSEAMFGIMDGEKCHLRSGRSEILAAWFDCSQRLNLARENGEEAQMLFRRVQEAIKAWEMFAARRLVILVREVMAGSWLDREVKGALKTVPDWWSKIE